VAGLELYGAAGCPYTAELRADLEWRGRPFVEYDVEHDPDAFTRLRALSGGNVVPVLVEDGRVTRIGWEGRVCRAFPGPSSR
jgi:mycoredoxin